MPTPDPAHIKETRDQCLDECLTAKLADDERELILEYYRGERTAKIEHRKRLAAARKKHLNALRIETHRIRQKLRPCISDCMERMAEGVAFA